MRRLGSGRDRGRVDLAWATAAGARLGRHTRVVESGPDRVVVAVPDEAWQLHLSRMRGELSSRLASVLGDGRARRLELVVRPEALPPVSPASADTSGITADPGDLEALRADGVHDPRLADAIARAMAASRRGE